MVGHDGKMTMAPAVLPERQDALWWATGTMKAVGLL